MAIVGNVPPDVIQRGRTIAWATALGAITVEALAEREQLSPAVAREMLDEAVSLRLMERHSVLVGYSELYTSTFAGRRMACKCAPAGGYVYPRGLSTYRVTIKEAREAIARASVIAALERRYPGYRLIGDRELRRDEREQGRRLASVSVKRYSHRGRSHCPDIAIWPPSTAGEPQPLPLAVEIEHTLKCKEDQRAICGAWARCDYVEAVLYFAETSLIEKNFNDTITKLKAEDRIVVNPLSDIVESIPGFELS
jgi:hypothetical protein